MLGPVLCCVTCNRPETPLWCCLSLRAIVSDYAEKKKKESAETLDSWLFDLVIAKDR